MSYHPGKVLDVASSLRKDDKIAVTFLLFRSPETGLHVIRELIDSTSLSEENGLFVQFLLQLYASASTEWEDSFVEACAIIQNFRAGRMLGLSRVEMQEPKYCGKVDSGRKSLFLFIDSLTEKQTRDLIAQIDAESNGNLRYLEETLLIWQLRGVINPELDSSSLETFKQCLKPETNATPSNEEFYPILDKNNLGYCIVFNNSTFTENTSLKELMPADKLSNRNGSDRDVDVIQKVFSSLNFTVQIHSNIPYAEFKDLLSNYSSTIPETHSFLVLIFMSHGTENVVYTSDSVPVCVEALEMAFQRNNCPQLTGKPKVLVIQACQGDNLQSVMMDGPKAPPNLSTVTMGPERGDALIACSTVKGYASFRDRNQGSWFIQEFCRELEENASSRDLVDIVTRVNKTLRSKTHLGMFMVPSLSTSLCKKIKLAEI